MSNGPKPVNGGQVPPVALPPPSALRLGWGGVAFALYLIVLTWVPEEAWPEFVSMTPRQFAAALSGSFIIGAVTGFVLHPRTMLVLRRLWAQLRGE